MPLERCPHCEKIVISVDITEDSETQRICTECGKPYAWSYRYVCKKCGSHDVGLDLPPPKQTKEGR